MTTFWDWVVEMIIFDCLMGMIGYPVGRVLLPLVSFGRAYAEPLGGPIRGSNWLGHRRDELGRTEVATSFTALIGLVAILIVLSAGCFLFRLFA